ncbi:MAG: SpoIIE family protein phosphatase [Coriobacteriales bacterium]|nr:SpoIIE family protein phosphatase [Coriobacteriales bacterium]
MDKKADNRPSMPSGSLLRWLLGVGSNSIAKKLLRAFLFVSMLGLFAAIVAAEVTFQSILGVTEQSNRSIGGTAAQSSDEALTATVLADTETLVRAKSEIIDGSLVRLSSDLRTLSTYLEKIYAQPEEYQPVPFSHLRNAAADTLSLQWALSPGMTSTAYFDERDLVAAGVLDETYRLGNLKFIAQALMADEPDIASIYITTLSGINIGYDAAAANKQSVDTIELRQRDWYLEALEKDGLYISDTYRDAFARGLNITMSMPVKDAQGNSVAVVAADINISDLDQIVSETTAGSRGYAVLLNSSDIISAPDLNEDNQYDLEAFLGDEAQSIIAQMQTDPNAVAQTHVATRDEDLFAVWAPVTSSGWELVILVPRTEITAPSAQLHAQITAMTDDAATSTRSQILWANALLIIIAALLVLFATLIARYVSRRITWPIRKLSKDVEAVASGELDYHADINTGDEIEELSHSFEDMTRRLKDYIAELNRTTAEKQRISTELNVAADIQASMLPNIFPPFPEKDEFAIFASMDAAREIGGDFYDFFFVEENRFVVVMADVSGKGVPAALFMVVAKTLIKSNAQLGLRPSEVFHIVNNLLTEGNDTNMFVTAFMAYLNLDDGSFTYVNAGHTPTLRSSAGGEFVALPTDPGFVLGAIRDFEFLEQQGTLAPGDVLFLYTDGVTEATSPDLQMFSEARLLEVLNANRDRRMPELLGSVKRGIDVFAAGSEQADDITMLAFKLQKLAASTGDAPVASDSGTATHTGDAAAAGDSDAAASTGDAVAAGDGDAAASVREESAAGNTRALLHNLAVSASVEKLPEVLEFTSAGLAEQGFMPDQIKRVNIAAEEIFVNIAKYAYPDTASGTVRLQMRREPATNALLLSFTDSGAPFNPLERPAPDITLDAEHRAIGGLGIHMALNLVDSLDYQYRDGQNVLTARIVPQVPD